MVTEIGGTHYESLHIHGIVWTDKLDEVERIWQYGHVWKGKKENEQIVNYVTERTANYIVKYMTKVDEIHPNYKSIILTSKGIGGNYKERKEVYRTNTGHKIALPTYWKSKIFTEDEREEQWTKLLDKGERWIGGEKFKEDDYKGIEKALEWQRKLNKIARFGSDKKNWDQNDYENQLRDLKNAKKMHKILTKI